MYSITHKLWFLVLAISCWKSICDADFVQPVESPTPLYNEVLDQDQSQCLASSSNFAYSLLKAVVYNPPLIKLFDLNGSPEAAREEIELIFQQQGRLKAKLYAGSFTVLLNALRQQTSFTNLQNAIVVTNAIDDFYRTRIPITPDDMDIYVKQFVDTLQSAIATADGSPNSYVRAFARGIINNQLVPLKPYTYHEFVSRLAGRYYEAIVSKCKPLSFDEVLIRQLNTL